MFSSFISSRLFGDVLFFCWALESLFWYPVASYVYRRWRIVGRWCMFFMVPAIVYLARTFAPLCNSFLSHLYPSRMFHTRHILRLDSLLYPAYWSLVSLVQGCCCCFFRPVVESVKVRVRVKVGVGAKSEVDFIVCLFCWHWRWNWRWHWRVVVGRLVGKGQVSPQVSSVWRRSLGRPDSQQQKLASALRRIDLSFRHRRNTLSHTPTRNQRLFLCARAPVAAGQGWEIVWPRQTGSAATSSNPIPPPPGKQRLSQREIYAQ